MVGDLTRWLRDAEANARERAPVMGADDRPNLTATDYSIWHPVELTHASERQRQRDQLPNHALLDQGGAARGAAGPTSAPGSALEGPPGARRAIPAGTADRLAPSPAQAGAARSRLPRASASGFGAAASRSPCGRRMRSASANPDPSPARRRIWCLPGRKGGLGHALALP